MKNEVKNMSNIYNRDALKDNILRDSDFQEEYYKTIASSVPTFRLVQAAALGTEGQLIGTEHNVPSAKEIDTMIALSTKSYEQIQEMFSDDPRMVSMTMALPSKNFVKDFQNIMDRIKDLTGADPVIGIENGFKSKSPKNQAITVKLMSPNGQAYQIKFTTPTNALAMDSYSRNADAWQERYNLGVNGDDLDRAKELFSSLNPIEQREALETADRLHVSQATAIDLYIIDRSSDASLKMLSRPEGFEQIIDVPERDVDMVRDECKCFDTEIEMLEEGAFRATCGDSFEMSLESNGDVETMFSSPIGEFYNKANVQTGKIENNFEQKQEILDSIEYDPFERV